MNHHVQNFPATKPLSVCIVGSGGTGTQIAQTLAMRGHTDIALVDLALDMAIGKSLDIRQSGALLGEDVSIEASDSLDLMRDQNIIIVTAGRGRRPGEPRERMLQDNATLIADIAKRAAVLSPDSYLIILTNPADLLTRVAYEASGFPASRVMGQGGILDSARMSTLVANELGVSVKDVNSMVLGGHGDSMVPVLDFVSIHGVPAKHLLTEKQWESIVSRTRDGGGEILRKFKTHGAFITPGLSVCDMVDALCRKTPRLLPISTMPSGEYGLTDVFLGLPALLSNQGVSEVVELPLSEGDLASLHKSAEAQREAWREWKRLPT